MLDDDLQQLIVNKSQYSENTTWSVEMFNKFRESRENVPCKKEMNVEMLNYMLRYFVLEIRKQDDSEYPP